MHMTQCKRMCRNHRKTSHLHKGSRHDRLLYTASRRKCAVRRGGVDLSVTRGFAFGAVDLLPSALAALVGGRECVIANNANFVVKGHYVGLAIVDAGYC